MKHVDEAICTSIRKSNERRKRGAFFLGFSQSPVNFIDALIESQGKDFKVALGEPISPDFETLHLSNHCNQSMQEEKDDIFDVLHMLTRRHMLEAVSHSKNTCSLVSMVALHVVQAMEGISIPRRDSIGMKRREEAIVNMRSRGLN
ncbi:hypothetical protein Tco_0521153 [Tanacetum coccineum]